MGELRLRLETISELSTGLVPTTRCLRFLRYLRLVHSHRCHLFLPFLNQTKKLATATNLRTEMLPSPPLLPILLQEELLIMAVWSHPLPRLRFPTILHPRPALAAHSTHYQGLLNDLAHCRLCSLYQVRRNHSSQPNNLPAPNPPNRLRSNNYHHNNSRAQQE